LVLGLEDENCADVGKKVYTSFLEKNPKMKCLVSNFGYNLSFFINDADTLNYVGLNSDLFEKDIGGFFSDVLYDEALFSTGGDFWKK
jgi:hypothetical protein